MTKLRKMRTMLGMSQKEVAGEIGVSEPYLSQLETGKRVPSDEVARKLASLYGMEIGELGEPAVPLRSPAAWKEVKNAINESSLEQYRDAAVGKILRQLDRLITAGSSDERQAICEIVAGAVEDFARECEERGSGVRVAYLKLLQAYIEDNQMTARSVRIDSDERLGDPRVSAITTWEQLRSLLANHDWEHGEKSSLARELKVSRQSVHRYIGGIDEPPAGIALQLLQWASECLKPE